MVTPCQCELEPAFDGAGRQKRAVENRAEAERCLRQTDYSISLRCSMVDSSGWGGGGGLTYSLRPNLTDHSSRDPFLCPATDGLPEAKAGEPPQLASGKRESPTNRDTPTKSQLSGTEGRGQRGADKRMKQSFPAEEDPEEEKGKAGASSNSSVQELRGWLMGFEKEQQQHHDRGRRSSVSGGNNKKQQKRLDRSRRSSVSGGNTEQRIQSTPTKGRAPKRAPTTARSPAPPAPVPSRRATFLSGGNQPLTPSQILSQARASQTREKAVEATGATQASVSKLSEWLKDEAFDANGKKGGVAGRLKVNRTSSRLRSHGPLPTNDATKVIKSSCTKRNVESRKAWLQGAFHGKEGGREEAKPASMVAQRADFFKKTAFKTSVQQEEERDDYEEDTERNDTPVAAPVASWSSKDALELSNSGSFNERREQLQKRIEQTKQTDDRDDQDGDEEEGMRASVKSRRAAFERREEEARRRAAERSAMLQ